MSKTEINLSTTEDLVAEIDSLVAEGKYRSRSEAINQAMKLLVTHFEEEKSFESIYTSRTIKNR